MDEVVEPARATGPRRQHVGVEALGEDAASALNHVTEEPAGQEFKAHRPAGDRQVG